MVKKIGIGIILALWIVSAIIGLYYYRQYRQCYIRDEHNQELTVRILEENTRLKNTMFDIRKSVDGIRESTGELESLNGSTISGIDDCIRELEEIRKQVYTLEKYCDSINYNIGCSVSD